MEEGPIEVVDVEVFDASQRHLREFYFIKNLNSHKLMFGFSIAITSNRLIDIRLRFSNP